MVWSVRTAKTPDHAFLTAAGALLYIRCAAIGACSREGGIMKTKFIAIALLTVVSSAAASLIAYAQNAPATGTPPVAAQPPRPGLVILEFKPAMDDLMTMLVQPRHIKLYFAGQAKNWKLAGFELDELRAGLARIGRTIPNYRNINVDTAVASIFSGSIKSVESAIKAGDGGKFNEAFGEMTSACNSCHVGMEHPFLVIKTPESNSYPNQEFRP